MFEVLKRQWAAEDKRHISARGKILMQALKKKDEEGNPVSMKMVAREFGLSSPTVVASYLDAAAMTEVTGGHINMTPRAGHKKSSEEGSILGGNTTRAIAEVMKMDRPKTPNPEYLEEYLLEGFPQKAAERLATAYEATEIAVKAGHVAQSLDEQHKKITHIALPAAVSWTIKVRKAATLLRHAANILNDAKINDLKRQETLTRVSDAHLKWMEQMERIENFHPDFDPRRDKSVLSG